MFASVFAIQLKEFTEIVRNARFEFGAMQKLKENWLFYTPPSMNRLSKAIFNSKKYSFSSFCVYSLNSLSLEILTKHYQNDPQIVSK